MTPQEHSRPGTAESDWEALYLSGDTRWDKGAPSPGLVDFLESHPELPRGSVCVPGCGTGHDVLAWARAGFKPEGLDIAPTAVRLANERLAREGAEARVVLGNFLSLTPNRPFDWLFEHTLFCAIHPSRRDDYARAVLRWLRPGGMFLAVHYMIPDEDGPPYGTQRDEILQRFSSHLHLIEEWVPRSYPNRTGLERIFWWERRD